MYLSPSSIVVNYVVTSLIVSCIFCVHCIIWNKTPSSFDFYCFSDVSKVHHKVNIFICCFPSWRKVKLHFSEVKTISPMYLIFMSCNNWEGPGLYWVSFRFEWDIWVIFSNLNIVLQLCCIKSTYKRIIIFSDFHFHAIKVLWLIVVKHNSSYLDLIITNDSIIDWLIYLTFRLYVVLPEWCCPCVRS